MKEICLRFLAIPAILVTILFTSCSPSQQTLDTTRTQVAANIFGTQTVLAPSATLTLTPTITKTPSTTSTSPTKKSTDIPGPTGTALPPTPTLDAAGIERMKLCYKASTIVRADYDALYKVAGWQPSKIVIDIDSVVGALRAERHNRSSSIIQKVEVCSAFACYYKEVLSMDGIVLSDQDCISGGLKDTIRLGNTSIGCKLHGLGGGIHCANQYREFVIKANKQLHNALESIYSIDPAELDTIADPIWQNVNKRYGVEIPQGE